MKTCIELPYDTLPLISNCDYCQTEDGFVHPDRVMDVNVLLYVEEGSFEIIEENNSYNVNKNSLIFLKQGLHHYGKIKCPPGTKWFFVHFYLPRIDNYEDISKFMPSYREGEFEKAAHYVYILPKQIEVDINSPLHSKFLTLKKMFNSEKPNDIYNINLYFYRILLDIYNEGFYGTAKGLKQQRVLDIMNYLDSINHLPFKSELISDRFSLSYKHINLIFKEETGITCQKYHMRSKMEAAAGYLKSSSYEIKEISDMLGFEDVFYFSNTFKKHFGISPGKYRKNMIVI